MVGCPDERDGGDRGAGVSGGVYGGVCLDGGVRGMATVQLSEPAAPAPPIPTGWENIIDSGEKILWQGQPDTTMVFRPIHLGPAFFGLFFSGFSGCWMVDASKAGGIFWMFGLVHFFAGIGVMLSGPFGGAWIRRHCFYTLTSRRAIIASDYPMMGKQLKSYPIAPTSVLELQEDGDWATLSFHKESRRDSDGNNLTNVVGFQRIRDGRHVFSLMRQIQSESK